MATTKSIQDLIDARNTALIRGDIDAVNAINETINDLGPFGDGTGGGTPVPPNLPSEPVDVFDPNGSSTVLDNQDFRVPIDDDGGISFRPVDATVPPSNERPFTPPTLPPINTTREDIVRDPSTGQDGGCDYRYSLGCPVFSRYATDAGCRILIPIYRTCYYAGTLQQNNTLLPKSELIGHIEITSWSDEINEVVENYTNEAGITGKKTTTGRKLSAEGLFQAIQDLGGTVNLQNWVQGKDGIFRTANSQIDINTVVSNLQSLNVAVTGGLQPRATLSDWAQFLSESCDLSNQPYCIVSETFVPNNNSNNNNNTGSGRFCNTNGDKVQIPNTKQLERTETRPVNDDSTSDQFVKVPNKPCTLGLARRVQDVQIYNEQYGYPCYANSDFSGNIIGYSSIETRETTEFGAITQIYVSQRPDPNCSYIEYDREYEEDDPANPCLGIIKKDVIKKYDDGRQEVAARGLFVRYYRKMDADCSQETIKIYHPLDLGKDVVSAKVVTKTTGLFNLSQSLECYHTSSTQATASQEYYYEVRDCDTCGTTPFFAVAYGNINGSGSLYGTGDNVDTATKAIYSQYRLLALESNQTQFEFYTNGVVTSSNDVYVINFYRNGISDRLDPGNFELNLAELNGGSHANSAYTGSNVSVSGSGKILTFIDDSGDTDESVSCANDPYVSYNIVSGSLTNGEYTQASTHTYGKVYPNLGIIVLDPYKLNDELSFNSVSGSNIAGDNAYKLFTSVSGSGVAGSYMKARNVRYKSSNRYFVRVGAGYANFSNNPTYVSGSDGYLFHRCFEKDPQTYITTVGLYNDFNELLAVAKLSQPVPKTFDNDVLIKIRLNW